MIKLVSTSMPTRAPAAHAAARDVAVASCIVAIASASTVAIGVGGAAVVTVAVAAAAAAVDARSGRIPNGLVVLATAAVAAGMVAEALPPATIRGAFVGAFVLAGPLLLGHVLAPNALGFGDVKLAAPLGAAVGLFDARLGLVALCIATGATATLGLVLHRSSMPLGPGLVAGAASSLVIGGWGPA